MIAAPLFHSWGFAHFTLGMGLCSTLVLRRKFDPEATLSLTAQHEATALVVVPVMLQRILELDDEVLGATTSARCKAVPVSGSALPGSLSDRWMDLFGENLYNLYGSTEVAWATIATPEDLRAAPGTAGTPAARHGRAALRRRRAARSGRGRPAGSSSATSSPFEGYTGGGGKDVIDGLMSSGDVGHFDEGGRLFVDGRDDDMIVSGGENVFPRRGRGPARRPRGGRRGGGLRRRRRGVRPAAEGRRRDARGRELSEDEVKRYVKANLAGYKVPRDVEFIDELPRNATGKVLKRELRDA